MACPRGYRVGHDALVVGQPVSSHPFQQCKAELTFVSPVVASAALIRSLNRARC